MENLQKHFFKRNKLARLTGKTERWITENSPSNRKKKFSKAIEETPEAAEFLSQQNEDIAPYYRLYSRHALTQILGIKFNDYLTEDYIDLLEQIFYEMLTRVPIDTIMKEILPTIPQTKKELEERLEIYKILKKYFEGV